MPRGGARPGSGPKRSPETTLRSMQKLQDAIKHDVANFRASLRVGFADGMSLLAANFPAIMRTRIEAALAGDERAGDNLIALYSRMFTPEMLAVNDDHPVAEYAKLMREQLDAANKEANDDTPRDSVDGRGSNPLNVA